MAPVNIARILKQAKIPVCPVTVEGALLSSKSFVPVTVTTLNSYVVAGRSPVTFNWVVPLGVVPASVGTEAPTSV